MGETEDKAKMEEWLKYANFMEARIEDIKSRADLEVSSLKLELKMAKENWWGEENSEKPA
jgi:hypothetical protein